MIIEKFSDGFVICADATKRETLDAVKNLLKNEQVQAIITDPPYGNIIDADWDRTSLTDDDFATWMVDWTQLWCEILVDHGAVYVWGGVGNVGFRPFMKYITKVEEINKFELASLITWSKRRAYGIQWSYLFTREELAYFVKGSKKKPSVFNVPLLDTKRGYAGYNKKYPAKSEYFRRTCVWTDINELFRNKIHDAQKPERVFEVPIKASSNEGDWILDLFGGSGVAAFAARKLNRKFIVIERKEEYFYDIVRRLNE